MQQTSALLSGHTDVIVFGGKIKMDNRIIGALIGLIGACGNNPKTENTDRLVIKSLAFTPCRSECNNDEAENIIADIRAEKHKIAPGCAVCTAPCGNTSDFDMSRLGAEDENTRNIKLQILSELHEIAVCAEAGPTISEDEMELLYKALAYVSYEAEFEQLYALLTELQKLKSEIQGV